MTCCKPKLIMLVITIIYVYNYTYYIFFWYAPPKKKKSNCSSCLVSLVGSTGSVTQVVCFRSVLESTWMYSKSRLSMMEECILWGKNAFSHGTKNQESRFPPPLSVHSWLLVLGSWFHGGMISLPFSVVLSWNFCQVPTWRPESANMNFLI